MKMISETDSSPVATGHGRLEAEGDRRRLEAVRGTILVVEDDTDAREVLVEALTLWGYLPIAVGSAEEAEFAVRNKSVDGAIVDVFLPGRSGANLMTRLRERFPDALLIGTSALSDAAMSRKCKGVGADIFIGKPMPLQKLAEALQSKHKTWH